jgi:capsular polysaccharide biosynthesis protein
MNLHPGDLPLFQAALELVVPATKLQVLKDVTVYPDGTIWRGRRIVRESLVTGRGPTKWKVLIEVGTTQLRVRTYRDVHEDTVWFIDNWSDGYFHWITDALPRLFTVRDLVAGRPLLLPSRYQNLKCLVPSVKPFGVDAIRFQKPDEGIRCARLLMPTHTAPTGNYNEGLINELRDTFTTFYASDAVADDRVYISRRKAPRRRLANEEDVACVMREYGFRVVYLEEHPFEDQVAILSKARYVASNHGAGLTNMLFMRPGGRVLELRREGDAHNNCFFTLASALKLDYFYQLCGSGRPRVNPRSRDLVANIETLRDNLAALVAS